LLAGCDGGDHVLSRLGYHNTNGNLSVIGGIGGIQRFAARIEPDLSLDGASQLRFQRSCVDVHPLFSPCGFELF
jgi:hypothetical protein